MSTPGTSTLGPVVVPTARRLRQPSWRDVRLLVGLALVLVSVVAGALVVSAADRTSPTYAASRALTPGESVAAADLVVVGARVTGGPSPYLSATGALRPGLVVLRPVLAGELVPTSAVGDRSQVTVRPVTVPVDPEIADGLQTGMLVDVWVARHRQDGDRGYDDPVRVASDVAVGERATRHGALGSASTTAVQVLVEGDVVPQLIHAVDDEDRVTLVPVPTTGGRDS
jgi:sulfur carrier protein ThiS